MEEVLRLAAERMAKKLGAVSELVYELDFYSPYHGMRAITFSVHYMNAEGLEVGYWLADMRSFNKLNPPRSWGEDFHLRPGYTHNLLTVESV